MYYVCRFNPEKLGIIGHKFTYRWYHVGSQPDLGKSTIASSFGHFVSANFSRYEFSETSRFHDFSNLPEVTPEAGLVQHPDSQLPLQLPRPKLLKPAMCNECLNDPRIQDAKAARFDPKCIGMHMTIRFVNTLGRLVNVVNPPTIDNGTRPAASTEHFQLSESTNPSVGLQNDNYVPM